MISFPFMCAAKNVPFGEYFHAPDFISTKDKMMEIFETWERKAAHLIATNDDPYGNAASFLKPGNYDVVGVRIEAWKHNNYLGVFLNEDLDTVLGFLLIQPQLLYYDGKLFLPIVSALVNPFHFNQGVGRWMVTTVLDHERKSGNLRGIVLQSEPGAITFWEKVGFRRWTETDIKPAFDDLTLMICSF